ncbi:helix-turn-helix transcriptional regulator [Sandaracinus amylolyticus]|uniref:Transcriptional regulator, AraC family protein n=1 Tax=Sandaracinus amylolyticus TaxID=927083 RepID=A0A0F6W0M2_9BACT|nr:helix-turn-helix transcriptional regulator [Sandaracinus amylolyticus]AKF04411.1 Transcriptional regulator, AraC family protein [Sandaracinus amylolyticus]
MRETIAHPDDLVTEGREWPEVSVVAMDYRASGSFIAPPLASYVVCTIEGTTSYMAREECHDGVPPHLPDGSAIVNAVGCGGHYVWTGPHRANMVSIAPSVVERAAIEGGLVRPARLSIVPALGVRDPVCEHVVHALAAERRLAPHAMQTLMIETLTSALAIRLVARFNASTTAAERELGGLGARTIAKIDAYVRDSTGPIGLEELAKLAGVSRFHFTRQFKRATGETPMAYVRRLRVERAKELLLATDMSLADVAAHVGFADQSHFTRVFRSVVGTTPARYGERRHRRRDPSGPRSS